MIIPVYLWYILGLNVILLCQCFKSPFRIVSLKKKHQLSEPRKVLFRFTNTLVRLRTDEGIDSSDSTLSSISIEHQPTEWLSSLNVGDEDALEEILNREFISNYTGPKVNRREFVQDTNLQQLDISNQTSQFQSLLNVLNTTAPADVVDYQALRSKAAEAKVQAWVTENNKLFPIDLNYATQGELAEDNTTMIRSGTKLSDYNMAEEYSLEDAEDEVIEEEQHDTLAGGYSDAGLREGSEQFFMEKMDEYEDMPREEFLKVGSSLIQHQKAINSITARLSNDTMDAEGEFGMSTDELKVEIMRLQLFQDRHFEVWKFRNDIYNINETSPEEILNIERLTGIKDCPDPIRAEIISVVCIHKGNTTALKYVLDIYEDIRNRLGPDPRIGFNVIILTAVVAPSMKDMTPEQKEVIEREYPVKNVDEKVPFEDGGGGYVRLCHRMVRLEDTVSREFHAKDPEEEYFRGTYRSMQMWVESYNVYHLIDGSKQLDLFGDLQPHILNSPKNRAAIAQKVAFALDEDASGCAALSPDYNRYRMKQGPIESDQGINTKYIPGEGLDCVVTISPEPNLPDYLKKSIDLPLR